MNTRKKPVPLHAYSFSVGFACVAASGVLYMLQEDNIKTGAFVVAAAAFLSHGLYDLHKENRLGKAFGFFEKHVCPKKSKTEIAEKRSLVI